MQLFDILMYVFYAVVAITALSMFFGSFFTIETQQAGIVQRFGKFKRIALAGLNWKWPFIDRLVYREDLHMQLLDVQVESKTKDDATVVVPVRVQYYVLPDKVWEAYYTLDEPEKQISAHVQNVILGQVPKLTLDQTYEQEEAIADRVKESLTEVMAKFGYGISNALLTQVRPADKVVAAMNDINAARREQIAAESRGEAERIMAVKKAEGEAQSKALQGKGIADQRRAIINGLKDSVETFKEAVDGVTSKDVMSLVLITQYLDTMKEIGAQGKTNTLFLPHSPGALAELFEQIQTSVLIGNKGSNSHAPETSKSASH